MNAVSIADQLKLIRAGLAGWAQRHRAAVEVGSRVSDLIELFAEGAPGGLRTRILFAGETKRGEIEEAGFVDREFLLVLSTPRGFTPKDDALRETGGHKPPYEVLDDLRQALRALKFSSDDEVDAGTNRTEQHPDVKSIGIFTIEGGRPVDAYQINLTIGTQLAAPED